MVFGRIWPAIAVDWSACVFSAADHIIGVTWSDCYIFKIKDNFCILNSSGTVICSWACEAGDFHLSPVLFDIDGDKDLEIFFATYAWDHNGVLLPGWPKTVGGDVDAVPAVGVFDVLGSTSVIVGSQGPDASICLLEVSPGFQAGETSSWRMYRHDAQNTACYRYGLVSQCVGDFDHDDDVDGTDAALLADAFGAIPGDPNWNAIADFNDDGVIDDLDLAIFAGSFGDVCVDGG